MCRSKHILSLSEIHRVFFLFLFAKVFTDNQKIVAQIRNVFEWLNATVFDTHTNINERICEIIAFNICQICIDSKYTRKSVSFNSFNIILLDLPNNNKWIIYYIYLEISGYWCDIYLYMNRSVFVHVYVCCFVEETRISLLNGIRRP